MLPSLKVDAYGDSEWLGFRGNGTSSMNKANLPERLDDTTKLWDIDLHGTGQSSPIIYQDKVYVTGVSEDNKRELITACYNLSNGEKVWINKEKSTRQAKINQMTSFGAPTPCIGENQIYSLFENGELFAYKLDGEKVWHLDLESHFGATESNHGQGSSPTLTNVGVVIVVDHDGESYIVCVDKNSGMIKWKQPRESRSAWSTPLVTKIDDKQQILVSASNSITSYSPKNGSTIWKIDSITGNNVPSPTVSKDYLVVGSNRRNNTMAFKFNEGHPELVWRTDETTSSFASPTLVNGKAFIINRAGVVHTFSLSKGKLLSDFRLPNSAWASPVISQKKIWFVCRDGSSLIYDTDKNEATQTNKPISLWKQPTTIYGVAAVSNSLILKSANQLVCFRRNR